VARRVFFSFHFDGDFWRTQQVRNIGSLEGQSICTANAWEEVKRKGDAAIERWIEDNIGGRANGEPALGGSRALEGLE